MNMNEVRKKMSKYVLDSDDWLFGARYIIEKGIDGVDRTLTVGYTDDNKVETVEYRYF